ncbi:MAG TPA: polysaccharide pyruvyl transferase family protein [Methanocorpusculum sp.]|nr:polysaccharide pyruvyl transferase family protein [Methanocorpusculum sp.]HJK80416.1 polysaccharide pyruvyl transferase family protein [Methanocorpusculum sp.]
MNQYSLSLSTCVENVKRNILSFALRGNYFLEFTKLKMTHGQKRIILIGTPDHGNLGDHAIAFSEKNFFKDNFPSVFVVEITGCNFSYNRRCIKKFISDDDVIVITGGGFLGSLWIAEEILVFSILSLFPNNKVIIFPQTIFFENTSFGRLLLDISKDMCRKHKNFHICLRDNDSYHLVKERLFANENVNCYLIPDMVLYLNCASIPSCRKEEVILCLREDKESCLLAREKAKILDHLQKIGMSIHEISTVRPYFVSISDREQELKQIFSIFSSSRLVITDRLHGMLFAVITGTPCIALDNLSGKVSGAYEWLRSFESIQIVNCFDELPTLLDTMLHSNYCYEYDPSRFYRYYQILLDLIDFSGSPILPQVQNIAHISCDDTYLMFTELIDHQHDWVSIFQSQLLKDLKLLHDEFGAKFTFYLPASVGKYHVRNIPDSFKAEFTAASNWLKFGFHCSDINKRVASGSGYEEFCSSYFEVYNAIVSFASPQSVARVLRLHRFYGSSDAVSFLLSQGITGLLCADDNRISYDLTSEEAAYLRKYGELTKNSMRYFRTDIRYDTDRDVINSLLHYHGTVCNGDEEKKVILFFHESLYSKIYKSLIESVIWLRVNGYSFGFLE